MKSALIVLVLAVLTGCAHTLPERDAAGRPPVYVDLTEQGRRLAEQGDYVRAEQYLAGALEAGADVDKVLPSLLRVCIASERYEAALAYTERFEPNARDSVEIELVLAALQMAVGQVDNARRTLELVLSQKDNAQAHYLLGELYYHTLQDFAAADTHYRRYLAMAPDSPHANNVRRLLLKSSLGKTENGTSELHGAAATDDTVTDVAPVAAPAAEPAQDTKIVPEQSEAGEGR